MGTVKRRVPFKLPTNDLASLARALEVKLTELDTRLPNLTYGIVTPNTNVIGQQGDLYIWVGGGANTTLWVKESGDNTNTGWVGK